jgi:hypothetical protein
MKLVSALIAEKKFGMMLQVVLRAMNGFEMAQLIKILLRESLTSDGSRLSH